MKKRLICLILIGVLSTSSIFMGCDNSVAKKSMEQAKTSIESKDYTKAISLLEITLDEDPKNEEAKKLYNIVDGYEKANKAFENNNIEEAKKLLNGINENYANYPIKADIDNLKDKVNKKYKETEKINAYLLAATNLYNDKKYKECKTFLTNNILGSSENNIDINKSATEEQRKNALELLDKCTTEIIKNQSDKVHEEKKSEQVKGTKAEYLKKLDNIEANLGDLKALSDTGVTANMRIASTTELKRWDDMLNEIYALLKVQLPANEMENLKNKQLNWIKYRDKTADNEASKFEGGTFAGVQYNITLARLTKERCYELVNTYMK